MLIFFTNYCFISTVGCRDNGDCPSLTACINERCIDPCVLNKPCAENALCTATIDSFLCRCLDGYKGDPNIKCESEGCINDNHCQESQKCLNNQCIDPCENFNCVQNADCKIVDHAAVCDCLPGFIGNPNRYCQEPDIPDCERDSDCPDLLACINNQCLDACTTLHPCGKNAHCKVIHKESVVIMACSCPEAYDGDSLSACRPSKYRLLQ